VSWVFGTAATSALNPQTDFRRPDAVSYTFLNQPQQAAYFRAFASDSLGRKELADIAEQHLRLAAENAGWPSGRWHDAAVITKNAISNKSPNVPKAAIEKSDRTAVVENDEAQKVDVYKINLDKPHSILAGATIMNNGEIYETIGYEDKRIQGLAHFKGTEFKGASALVKVVRW